MVQPYIAVEQVSSAIWSRPVPQKRIVGEKTDHLAVFEKLRVFDHEFQCKALKSKEPG